MPSIGFRITVGISGEANLSSKPGYIYGKAPNIFQSLDA
jgi:hypothetical protein